MRKQSFTADGGGPSGDYNFDVTEPQPPAGLPQMQPRRQPRLPVPYVTYGILAVCSAVYLYYNLDLQHMTNGVTQEHAPLGLGFAPGIGMLWPGIITHMFAHASFWHLLGNMCGVFFLGRIIEWRYGSVRYGVLYFISGLFAALAQAALSPNIPMIGASGALAGVMAAFLRHYPHAKLYLYGILPIPTWLLIPAWLLLNVIGAAYGDRLQIAFVAHIAGFAAGMLLSYAFVPPGARGGVFDTWFRVD
jgi:membrane associated rhomboid family serine protease